MYWGVEVHVHMNIYIKCMLTHYIPYLLNQMPLSITCCYRIVAALPTALEEIVAALKYMPSG